MNDDLLLTPEEIKAIEEQASSLEGVVVCMQSSLYTAAYLAAKAQLAKVEQHYETKLEQARDKLELLKIDVKKLNKKLNDREEDLIEAKKQERQRIISDILEDKTFRDAMVSANPLVANTILYVIDTIREALKGKK